MKKKKNKKDEILPEALIARLAVDLIAKRLQQMKVYRKVVVTVGEETVAREVLEGHTLSFTVNEFDIGDLFR